VNRQVALPDIKTISSYQLFFLSICLTKQVSAVFDDDANELQRVSFTAIINANAAAAVYGSPAFLPMSNYLSCDRGEQMPELLEKACSQLKSAGLGPVAAFICRRRLAAPIQLQTFRSSANTRLE
jgi:hypothetical protein